jgi:elongation factor 3
LQVPTARGADGVAAVAGDPLVAGALSVEADAMAFDPGTDRLYFPAPLKMPGGTTDLLVLSLKNATFQHPGADAPVLRQVNLEARLGCRIAITGKNGSGKSTLLELIAGRLGGFGPFGELWMHASLRLVYVAQHHESQLGDFMDCTPHEYIQRRFKKGYDAEMPLRPMAPLEPKQVVKIKQVARMHGKRGKEVETIISRQIVPMKDDPHQKECLYEVKWKDLSAVENTFEREPRLKSLGVLHLVEQFNEMMSDTWGDGPERSLSAKEIVRHLADFGLPEEASQQRRISMLSSGQKSRLMLAASFWTIPHIVCLDEPTNYLDSQLSSI